MFTSNHGVEYTYGDLELLVFDSICACECDSCGYECAAEPDAEFPCPECDGGQVSSVLIQAGLM